MSDDSAIDAAVGLATAEAAVLAFFNARLNIPVRRNI